MPINKNEITKEMLKQALECKTAEDLIAFAKTEGVDLTKEEAEAYFDELSECELKGQIAFLYSKLFNSREKIHGCFILVWQIIIIY